jgi:CubicO group peptidase (beta-lactamase class C family)
MAMREISRITFHASHGDPIKRDAMTADLSKAEASISEALGRVFPAAQVVVRHHGEVILSRAYGWLDPETQQRPTQLDTLFDLASVTKLFVVTAFMTLVEGGRVALDQPVRSMLPEFDGPRPIRAYDDPLKPGEFVQVVPPTQETVDAGRVTFRNLLSHNSGLPAWRPLYQVASSQTAKQLALQTYFSYPTGAHVIYSDIGLILLGLSIERLTGLSLDQAVQRRVTVPIGLTHTGYLPIRPLTSDLGSPMPKVNIAPTEICAWRKRRIVGEVHDENAAKLGGVAGHAGIFSTAADTAKLGQMYLDLKSGQPQRLLLHPVIVAEMTRLQAEDGATRRGLGFALWCADPEASGNPFSESVFGHTGFTGTSLWIDPRRELVVACLTNRVYYGRDAGGILAFRVALHRAIAEAIEATFLT